LTSDEFEARDLAFGLSVRPRQGNCSPNGGFVLGNAAGERGNQTGAGTLDPRRQFGYGLAPDHHVEFDDDLASLNKRGDARFEPDWSYGDADDPWEENAARSLDAGRYAGNQCICSRWPGRGRDGVAQVVIAHTRRKAPETKFQIQRNSNN
jgi:hypothetical protein